MGSTLLYNYLPSRCIRVLTVEAKGHLDTQVRGEISIIDLNDRSRSRFSALSYVWGSPDEEPRSIICGGITVLVLPNVYLALQSLRDKLGTFTIWIDAICINQEDAEEKVHQIPLMGEIYAQSEFVYVWLGAGSMRTKRAMKYLRKPPFINYLSPMDSIGDDYRHPKVWSALFAYLSEGFKYTKTLFPAEEPSPRSRNLADATLGDLATLLDAKWLERMWTYQEILLASNPIIVCGDDHLAWPTFAYTVAFLEYSGCFYRGGGLGYPPVTGWTKVALARDYLRCVNADTVRSHSTGMPPNSSLQAYIEFVRSLVKYEHKLIMTAVVVPVTTLLLMFAVIEIIGVTDWENYRRAKQNMIYAAIYNDLISSMIAEVVAKCSAVSRVITTARMQSFPSTTNLPTTIAALSAPTGETQIPTDIIDILTKLHDSSLLDPTELMGSAIEAMSTAVVSVVSSCQSDCIQRTTTQGCFDSCTAGATAMPTLRTIGFQDADVIAHRSRESYTSTFWGMFIYAWVLIVIGIVVTVLKEFRKNATIQPTDQPSELAVDLVDALLYRKARLDHDKAFALRNVLQRLSKAKIPLPDYSRPLDETFSDLNIQLFQAIGCSRLLTVASIIPLPNHPCWMVNWSKKPDTFWLSGSGSMSRKIGSGNTLKSLTLASKFTKGTLASEKAMRCPATIICHVDRCFKFAPTVYGQDIPEYRFNLEVGLAMARCSAEVLRHMHNCKSHLVNLLSLGAPRVPKGDITKWVDFLYDKYKKPDTAHKLLARKPKLLQTQISISRQFSRNGRKLFWYCSDEKVEEKVGRKGMRSFYRYTFGICRDTVENGDVLIDVSGASTLLIVAVPSWNSREPVIQARLVSPAILRGERMKAEEQRDILLI